MFDAGYIFGRTGWGESRRVAAETYFTLRFGHGRGNHGHDDQGSLTLYGEGTRLAVDPGLYAYEFDRRRDYVLSRDAHNAVVVAGRRSDPSKPARLVRTRRDRRSFEAIIDVRAYEPITHRRRVVFSRQLGYLLVEDRLDAPGSSRERFTQLWHLRQDSSPMVVGPTVRTRREHGNVVIRQLIPVGSTRVVNGRESPLQGWLSLRYRELRAAPVIEARVDGGSARFLTLIVPVMRSKSRVKSLRREGDAGRRDLQGDDRPGERARHDDEGPHEDQIGTLRPGLLGEVAGDEDPRRDDPCRWVLDTAAVDRDRAARVEAAA